MSYLIVINSIYEIAMKRNPAERILDVMEYLMARQNSVVKQVDIATDLNLAPATLNRIVKVLSERGYLFRTSERYLVRNFKFSRKNYLPSNYFDSVSVVAQSLTERLEAAIEVVLVDEGMLYWHSRTEHPTRKGYIRARAGFRRRLHHLDALSKLYLATLDDDVLDTDYLGDDFFTTYVDDEGSRQISWISKEETLRQISEAKGDDFAWDEHPNHLGIRRYAMRICDPLDGFVHLLSVVDAPIDSGMCSRRVSECASALKGEAEKLMHVYQNSKMKLDFAASHILEKTA